MPIYSLQNFSLLYVTSCLFYLELYFEKYLNDVFIGRDWKAYQEANDFFSFIFIITRGGSLSTLLTLFRYGKTSFYVITVSLLHTGFREYSSHLLCWRGNVCIFQNVCSNPTGCVLVSLRKLATGNLGWLYSRPLTSVFFTLLSILVFAVNHWSKRLRIKLFVFTAFKRTSSFWLSHRLTSFQPSLVVMSLRWFSLCFSYFYFEFCFDFIFSKYFL